MLFSVGKVTGRVGENTDKQAHQDTRRLRNKQKSGSAAILGD